MPAGIENIYLVWVKHYRTDLKKPLLSIVGLVGPCTDVGVLVWSGSGVGASIKWLSQVRYGVGEVGGKMRGFLGLTTSYGVET